MANIIQAFPKGSGGGGGHTILDSSGTAAAQESNLQFTGLSVTDDSVNGKTEVAGEGLNAESINDIAEANSTVPVVIIGDANNYSTNEKVIGKWIDGKLVYQKTIVPSSAINLTANTWVEINNVIPNIANVLLCMGHYNSVGTIPLCSNKNTNNGIVVYSNIGINNVYAFTVQYTKTT